LQSLPFGVLVTDPPERDPRSLEDHREVPWFGYKYAVSVMPSVSALVALRQRAGRPQASAPFLGIGNPILGSTTQRRGLGFGDTFRDTAIDIKKVHQLGSLPETADELLAIARILGAGEGDLLLGEDANETMVCQYGLDRYKVIAFATHGLVAGELDGLAEPALVLTPPAEPTPQNCGLLTSSKIATLKIDADWVVLSACNTAAGDGTPGADGLTGLAKAFFYAGARALLVSHWPVETQATVALTTGAFLAMKQNPATGRAQALQHSMMKMFKSGSLPEFAHPQAWAPFVLVGEGRSQRPRESQGRN
jgi:CHAT domain-containing protein